MEKYSLWSMSTHSYKWFFKKKMEARVRVTKVDVIMKLNKWVLLPITMKAKLGRQVLVQKERCLFSCCPGKMVGYVPSRLPAQACSSCRDSEGKASFLHPVILLAFELGSCPFMLLAFGVINVKTSPALSWPVGETPLVIPHYQWYQDQWGGEGGSCRLWRGIAGPPSGPWDTASLSPPLHVGQVSTCPGPMESGGHPWVPACLCSQHSSQAVNKVTKDHEPGNVEKARERLHP